MSTDQQRFTPQPEPPSIVERNSMYKSKLCFNHGNLDDKDEKFLDGIMLKKITMDVKVHYKRKGFRVFETKIVKKTYLACPKCLIRVEVA